MIVFFVSLFMSHFSLPLYDYGDIHETDFGFEGLLPIISGEGPYNDELNPDASSLSFKAYFESENRIHISIKDSNRIDYVEIPKVLQLDEVSDKSTNPKYALEFPNGGGFIVRRKSSDEVIFDTSLNTSLVMEERYIELTTKVNSNPRIYGWGEKRTRLALKYPWNYTFHNQDRGTPADSSNLYGSWPFHIEILPSGLTHGVLYFNQYATVAELANGYITYRSIGGYLDFYIFLGPDMKSVMSQFTELVGKPILQPHWAFGFHQCRWGWPNLDHVKEVVQNFTNNQLPLDVLWSDIDYMNGFRLFTTDPNNYPTEEFNAFLNQIRVEKHIESVAIVDPGFKYDPDDYAPYNDLLISGAFIRNVSDLPYIGEVWPGLVLFPDFSNPAVEGPWNRWVKHFLNNSVNLTGLWLDMNEIASFCYGECTTDTDSYVAQGVNDRCDTEDNYTAFDCLPFLPMRVPTDWHDTDFACFQDHNIPNRAKLYGGDWRSQNNLYAFLENELTRKAMKERGPDNFTLNSRPFILSRSSFIGSGHNNAIWLGDNTAHWSDLVDSLAGIIMAGLAGIPFSGVDAGGFNCGEYKETGIPADLHVRWIQAAAAIYPFFRDHSAIECKPHEPYIHGEPYTTYMRHSIHRRQRIQSHFYTLQHIAHHDGTPIVRPLIMEFPDDPTTFPIDTQVMVGSALLVSPVLQENSTTAQNLYFPHARWYLHDTGKEDTRVTNGTLSKEGADKTGFINITDVDIDSILIHVRGGTVHTEQEKTALTLVDMKDSPLTVVAALDYDGSATGELYLDDGFTDDDTRYTPDAHNPVLHLAFAVSSTMVEVMEEGKYSTATFTATSSSSKEGRKYTFTSTVLDAEYNTSTMIEMVKILGSTGASGVIVLSDGVDVTQQFSVSFNYDTKVFLVRYKTGAGGGKEEGEGWYVKKNLTIVWSSSQEEEGETEPGNSKARTVMIVVVAVLGVLLVAGMVGVIAWCVRRSNKKKEFKYNKMKINKDESQI